MTTTPRPARILYLHGFATGPRSRKARMFAAACAADDKVLVSPDLNVPSFATLSFPVMTELVVDLLAEKPEDAWLYAVASSMGASVLVNSLVEWRSRNPGQELPLTAMVFFAPTHDFRSALTELIGPTETASWHRGGTKTFPHHAAQREIAVSASLLDDYRRPSLSELASLDVPTAIIHGAKDDVVAAKDTEDLLGALPNATLLHEPDADHRLSQLGTQAWDRARAFFSQVSKGGFDGAGDATSGTRLTYGVLATGDLRALPEVTDEAAEVLMSAYGAMSHSRETHIQRMVDEDGILAWARDGSRMVGCSLVRADGKWGACGVLAAYRRRGVGIRLSRLGQERIAEQFVEVGTDSPAVLRMVLGAGFRPVYDGHTALSVLRAFRVPNAVVVGGDELGVIYRRPARLGNDATPLRLCVLGFHETLG